MCKFFSWKGKGHENRDTPLKRSRGHTVLQPTLSVEEQNLKVEQRRLAYRMMQQQGGGSLKLGHHYEGQLNKYTNVMKGWQFRWFVINPDHGTLEYHVSEAEMKAQPARPRGTLHLAGAVISPSEEDSHTFVVNSASGESYKLRAVDAKERQEWITRLRVVAEVHSQALAQTNSPLVTREAGNSSGRVVDCNLSVLDAFAHVQEWLQRAESSFVDMGTTIDRFPTSGPGTKSVDRDLLALKAVSQASLGCLEGCLFSLQLQQRTRGISGSEWDEV